MKPGGGVDANALRGHYCAKSDSIGRLRKSGGSNSRLSLRRRVSRGGAAPKKKVDDGATMSACLVDIRFHSLLGHKEMRNDFRSEKARSAIGIGRVDEPHASENAAL